MKARKPVSHEDFRASQTRVTLSGLGPLDLDLAFTDVGKGDPVVLLHGIPTWSYLYADVIPLLQSHYRVIAPDFLGHGWSDRRDRFDRSLPAQVSAVLALLDTLGIDKATFVGHDTGGGVSLILAVEHPERVQRLVITNAVAYDSWPIEDMIALGDPQWRSKPGREVAEFVASGLADGIHNRERLTRRFTEGIVAPYSDDEGALSLIRNASALNTNHTMALVDRHETISAPTLVLWGVQDPWQPIADGERLSREIPNAELVRVEASHWIPWDAPEAFAAGVLEFLEHNPVSRLCY
jgi:pimeloyl-ACP methyl ester carboxylesterase